MTRSQALALGSPAIVGLIGCLLWAAIDHILSQLGQKAHT